MLCYTGLHVSQHAHAVVMMVACPPPYVIMDKSIRGLCNDQ